MSERIYLWDNLKVMLMMMVVMTHSVCVYQIEEYEWIQYLWIFIMTYTMPLFMMVSGFWFKPRNVKFCLKHYLYPCLLFSIVNICGGAKFGFYSEGNIHFKSGYAMWYIWVLFIYNLITPWLHSRLGIKRLILLSLVISFVCGFKFVSNTWLDAQRVVHFYPFYVLGMWLRTKEKCIYHADATFRKYCLYAFLACNMMYITLCYLSPNFCYGTGFSGSHGLSLKGFAIMWGNFLLTLVMSFCVIILIPNKKLAITKYGSRTMNVYLLHMSIVFPLCWYYMRPIMNEWYGYILYVLGVPLLCTLLFSKQIDKLMSAILAFPNKKANIKN